MATSITEIGKLQYAISGDSTGFNRAVKNARSSGEKELDRLTDKFYQSVRKQDDAVRKGNQTMAATWQRRQDIIAKGIQNMSARVNTFNQQLEPKGFFAKFDSALSKAGIGGGQGSALGALLGVGAVAGIAVAVGTKFVEIAGRIITAGFQQAIEAGIQAAEIERLTVALGAVTGSGEEANRTVAEMIELSRKVPGLNFQSALEGAQRLRAVGFNAKEAKQAVEGLAKVRLLSGGTKQDLDAVLLNFQQIRSYGKLTGDELRETLMRMPYMSKIFQEAFGTINTDKIRDLNLSAEELFKHLFAAMDDVPQIADTAQIAWEKFMNEILLAQVAFGEPLLEPFTLSLQYLTKTLQDNEAVWSSWGQTVGDVLGGLTSVLSGVGDSEAWEWLDEVGLKVLRLAAAAVTLGSSEVYGWLIGKGVGTFEGIGQNRRQLNEKFGAQGKVGITAQEYGEAEKDEQKKADNELVRTLQENSRLLEKEYDNRLRDVESYAKLRQAAISGSLRLTLEDESQYQKQLVEIQLDKSRESISALQTEIAQKRKLIDSYVATFPEKFQGRVREGQELSLETKLSQLQKERADYALEEANARNKLLEINQRIADSERNSQDRALSLNLQGLQFYFTNRQRVIERGMDLGYQTTDTGLRALAQLELGFYQESVRNAEAKYLLDSQNNRLSLSERKNLETSFQLDLLQLEQSFADKRLELRDRLAQSEEERVRANGDRLIELYTSVGTVIQSVVGSLSNTGNLLTGTDTAVKKRLDGYGNYLDGWIKYYGKTRRLFQEEADRLNKESLELEKQITKPSQATETQIQSPTPSGSGLSLDELIKKQLLPDTLAGGWTLIADALADSGKSYYRRVETAKNQWKDQYLALSEAYGLIDQQGIKLQQDSTKAATTVGDVVSDTKKIISEAQKLATASDNLGDAADYFGQLEEIWIKTESVLKGQEVALRKAIDALIKSGKSYKDYEKYQADLFDVETNVDLNKLEAQLAEERALYDYLLTKGVTLLDERVQASLRKMQDVQARIEEFKAARSKAREGLVESGPTATWETVNALRSNEPITTGAYRAKAEQEYAAQALSVRERIMAAERHLAETSEDVADRIKVAHLETAIEIKSRYEEAMIAIDRAQQEMADKAIIHQERIQASVLEAIVSAGGITDILAQAESGAIYDSYKLIDDSVASLVENLGLADTALGNFFATMLAGLAKLAAQQIFWMIFGGGQQGGNGQQEGTGGSWWSRLLNTVIGAAVGAVGGSIGGGGLGPSSGSIPGGSTGSGGAPGLTAGFAGAGLLAGNEKGVVNTGGADKNPTAGLVGGGNQAVIAPTFNFYPNKETGKFSQESAEQSVKKMMAMQQKVAKRNY